MLDDLWDPGSCRSVSLGSEPVRTLLVLDDSVWASCGNSVTVVDVCSLHTQVSRDAWRCCNQVKSPSHLINKSRSL